jgi:nucleotide-binding universal stress UspA family protein
MTQDTSPVLVGIDGTASGLEALALGSALAILTGSPMVLGAVYGYMGDLVWPPEADATLWLREAEARVGDVIPWSTRTVQASSAAHGLTTLAESGGARLIVLGSSRHGPVGRVLAGSTVRQVAHGAPCAVAVAPHDWRIRAPDVPLTFGAAVTDSVEARDALTLAARLAEAGHAPLRVLTVVHRPPPAHPMFAATGTSYGEWRRERRAEAERAARALSAAVAPLVDTDFIVLEGDPVDQLADASHDLDVLVVGSRRYGPLRSALLGGVSSPLIERAACPVVIVPRGAHAEPSEAAPVEESARA